VVKIEMISGAYKVLRDGEVMGRREGFEAALQLAEQINQGLVTEPEAGSFTQHRWVLEDLKRRVDETGNPGNYSEELRAFARDVFGEEI
jgi:hypothetical protein